MKLKYLAVILFVQGILPASGWATPVTNADTNAPPTAATNAPAAHAPSKFIDPQDGWFDVSGFLATAYGFVPMVVPITEPAVGYGVGGGLVFIDRPDPQPGEKPSPPNMTVVGGLATANGTWGMFGGDSRWWLDDRLQTKIGVAYASVNLSYHGIGESPYNYRPVSYNLKPLGELVEARYRLGSSPWLAGVGYAFSTTEVSFSGGVVPPDLNLPSLSSRIGGFKPVLAYDTRNNVFTPTKGIYAELTTGLYDTALGGDSDFQTVEPVFIYYLPLGPKWTLGVNVTGGFSFGDAPFYARPSITLRGAPAQEYQAENISQIETELRWQFWRRFSLVGFAGGGVAWNNFDRFDSKREIVTGGTGFRYEIARKYGLHLGADIAFGRDGPALYIQFGSAWFRP